MDFKGRRVVTGHDHDGHAVVKIDEIIPDVASGRPGQSGALAWATEGFPVDNSDGSDGLKQPVSVRPVSARHPNGTAFRIARYMPGVEKMLHRTYSMDYAVVLSGEIDLELDGTEVHLVAGDVLVQRGTLHNWANRGTVPCVMAFVLVDAAPVKIGGNVLAANR